MARNRKYVEIEGRGCKTWVGASLNAKELRKLERNAVIERTGREVVLDTDFAVQGDYREWDREAAYRIGKMLNESVVVVRL